VGYAKSVTAGPHLECSPKCYSWALSVSLSLSLCLCLSVSVSVSLSLSALAQPVSGHCLLTEGWGERCSQELGAASDSTSSCGGNDVGHSPSQRLPVLSPTLHPRARAAWAGVLHLHQQPTRHPEGRSHSTPASSQQEGQPAVCSAPSQLALQLTWPACKKQCSLSTTWLAG